MFSDRTYGFGALKPRPAWKCAECGVMSSIDDWKEMSVDCELCGDHEARVCPSWGEIFDHIYDDERMEKIQPDVGDQTIYD